MTPPTRCAEPATPARAPAVTYPPRTTTATASATAAVGSHRRSRRTVPGAASGRVGEAGEVGDEGCTVGSRPNAAGGAQATRPADVVSARGQQTLQAHQAERVAGEASHAEPAAHHRSDDLAAARGEGVRQAEAQGYRREVQEPAGVGRDLEVRAAGRRRSRARRPPA